MKIRAQSALFNIVDICRNSDISRHSISAFVIDSAYLFWQDPNAVNEALSLGKIQVDYYVKENISTNKIKYLAELADTKAIPWLEIFLIYSQLYSDMDSDRQKFAEIFAEAFFSGVTEVTLQGEYIDNSSAAELLSEIAKYYSATDVCDGAAGYGRILYLLNPKHFTATEIDAYISSSAARLFTMLGRSGTYITADSLNDNDQSLKAELYIAQPPFAQRIRGKKYEEKPYLLVDEKIPSSGADSLWIQHALYNVTDRGRVILQLAPGWFYRGGYDLALRRLLIDQNLIESVIYLPENLLNNTGIETNIIILNKSKNTPNIQLINAKNVGVLKRNKRLLSAETIKEIVRLLENSDKSVQIDTFDSPILSKNISLMDIHQNQYDLNSNLYFQKESELDFLSVDSQLKMLEEALADFEIKQREFMEIANTFLN